jgi:short-subunit dehydrogenase
MVTGASSGIGLELARLLAADGHDLVLVARRADVLQQVASELESAHQVRAYVLADDLSDPAAPRRVFETLGAEGIELDILVNNAGFGLAGPLASADAQRTHDMIEVNVTAVTMLTRLALPAMVARGRGRILNVASTAAFQPGPLMAVYYAAKAYVLSFSEAIADELRDTGVTVTALCPGPTRTRWADVAGVRQSPMFTRLAVADAGPVARAGYDAMMRGRRVVIPGLVNRLVAFGNRFVPRRLATSLARRAQEHRR